MRRRKSVLAISLAALLGVLVVGAVMPADAHTRSTSYSSWEIDGREARIRFRITQLELTRLPWGIVSPPALRPELASYLPQVLRLEADGVACSLVGPVRALAAPKDRALIEWHVACPEQGVLAIRSELMLEVAPSHLHFARIRTSGEITERVLSNTERIWRLRHADGSSEGGSSIASYVGVGVEHIATGYDHLVFLLALLLLASRLGEVVTIVTGFTIAHSITLALAALGRVQPEAAAVESLIGASIVLVAAENGWHLTGRGRVIPRAVVGGLALAGGLALLGWGVISATTLFGLALFSGCYFGLLDRVERPARLRAAIAFCFGLVHGFGFAGVLTEIALPQGRLLPALLGFNVGVELGQLAVVALVWPLLFLLARVANGRPHRLAMELGTAAVCAAGFYWMIERAYA
jgi:hypothetical protein